MQKTYTYLFIYLYALLLKFLGYIPLYGVTSFGISTLCAPLIGFFTTSTSCILLYIVRSMFAWSMGAPLYSYTVYLPTLAGALVLSTQSKKLIWLIAMICIITFSVHPIGYESILYSCFWLIPLAITLIPEPSIFWQSLASTFMTHAVGSTIFIYTHTTTSLYWYTLIPHVLYERLVSALLLTVGYYIIYLGIDLINQLRYEGLPCQNQ